MTPLISGYVLLFRSLSEKFIHLFVTLTGQ